MTHLPCVCRVSNYATFNPANGDHVYDAPWITKKQQWLEEDYWAKPNTVLDILELMKELMKRM